MVLLSRPPGRIAWGEVVEQGTGASVGWRETPGALAICIFFLLGVPETALGEGSNVLSTLFLKSPEVFPLYLYSGKAMSSEAGVQTQILLWI